VLEAEETLDHALQRTAKHPAEVLLVRLNSLSWSALSSRELVNLVEEGKGDLTLDSVLAGRKIPFLHPDLPLHAALRHVDRWPLVPVVSRASFHKLEGVISQGDVLQRYQKSGEQEDAER
jgi:CBS domain-containing protein